MTTPNQLLDTYVIETIIKDETAAGLKAAQDNLNKTAEVARKTAAELTATGEAGGNMATQIAKAVPSLDKMAARADAVTKAYNALKRAQADLVTAQQAVDRAMQAGDQDIDKMQRTIAAFAEKVDIASKKLGEQRAIAAANEASISAWAGAIGEGSQAVGDYANSVAAATRAQSQMSVTMAQAAGGQENLNRILGGNASTDEQTLALMSKRRAELDDVYAASMKYATALEKIDTLEALTAISTNVATAAREKLNAAYAESAAPLQNIIAKEQEAAAAAEKSAAANEALRAKIDPVYKLSKQYETALNDLDEGLQKNIINQKQYEIQLQKLNAGYELTAKSLNKVETAHNGAGYAARFMGIQFSQAISGIATGQDFFTVLLQQGHQLIDVFLAMGEGIGGLGKAFKGMFDAIGGWPTAIIAAAAAAIYFLTAAGNEHIGMLNALKESLKGSHDDYVQLATDVDTVSRKIAASTSLSISEARDAASALANNQMFAGTAADLERLTKLSYNLAAAMKTDLTDANKTLSEAMMKPVEVAKKLQASFANDITGEFIRTLEATPRLGDQFEMLTKKLATLSGEAGKNSLSPLRQAWDDLVNSITGSTNVWEKIEHFFVDVFVATLKATTHEIQAMGEMWNWTTGKVKEAYQYLSDIGNQDVATTKKLLESTGKSTLDVPAKSGAIATGNFSLSTWNEQQQTNANVIASILQNEFSANNSQIVGVIANAFRESGLTNIGTVHTDVNGLSTGGLMQWNGPRLNNLLSSNGTSDLSQVDLPTQVRFMMQEIANNATWSAMWKEMADKTGAEAAADFTKRFEVPKNANRDAATDAATAAAILGQVNNYTGTINQDRATSYDVDKLYGGTRADTADKLETELKKVHAAQDQVAISAGKDSDVYAGLVQREDELIAKQYLNVDAMTSSERAASSQLRANEGLTEGERSLASAIEARRQVALNSKGSFSSAEEQQANVEWLLKQHQALIQLEDSINRVTIEQTNLGIAYQSSDQDVIDTTIKQQAYNEVIKHAIPNTADFDTQLKKLINTYSLAAEGARILSESKSLKTQQQSIDYYKTEADVIGMGELAQTRYLAVYKATVDAHVRDGDELTTLSKKIITNTGLIADQTAAIQKQKNSMSELESTYDTVMGDISNSITDAFKIGGTQVLKFKDIATSVVNDLEKEFIKLALTNPLKNLLFGTNLADITSVGGLLGSLFGNSSTAVGSTVSGGSSIANLVSGKLVSDSNSVADGGSVGVLGGATAVAGGASILDKIGGLFTKGTSTVAGLTNWATDKIIDLVGNADTAFDLASTATEAGSISNSQLLGASFANALGASDATAESVALVAGQIADALPYIGTAITVVTDLATGNYRGAALVGSFAAAGAAIGTFVPIPGIGTAAGLAIGATIGTLIDTFFPAHALNPYQNVTESAVGGRLAATDAASQVLNTDSTVASLNKFNTAFNSYMDAWGIQLGNIDSVVANFGQGIKGFTQLTDINQMFSTLYFKNAVNDGSNFAAAKGALTGMTFQNTAGLEAELEKIAGFAASMDALGIKLVSVGSDLTNIQVGSIAQSTGADKDLRIALNADLPRQTFATAQALSDEIDKVNTFVNSTVPGLVHPIEQTTSSIVENAAKVQKMYEDAIAQAASYGLDYTNELKKGEAEALAIVRKSGTDAIANNATTIRDTLETTISGNVNYIQTTLDNFDISSRTTMDSVSKTWTDTYGDIVKNTHDYVQAMQDEADVLSVSRLDIQFKAQNTSEQNALGMLGTDTIINARGLTAQGLTGAAALANLDVSQALEVSKYKATLEQYYGIGYITTQEYLDKINKLEEVQGMERAAIVKKYGDALTGQFAKQHQAYTDATTDFNTAKNALISALNASISSLNTQISAIKSNTDALHNASLTLTNFTTGMKTGASSPLTPKQQLDAAQAEFNKQVAIMHGTGSVADRTAAASGATSAASTLLTQAGSYFGQAGTDYASIFNTISDTLNSSADSFAAEGSVAQQQLDVLQRQLDVAQALLDKTNALGAGADANFATLEATMIAKFNDMINALYDLNKVDPTPGTIADAGTYTQQGNSYGLPDIYNNRSIADQQAIASERVVASNTPTTADWTFSDGSLIFTNTMPFPTGPFNKAAYTIKGWFSELGQTPSLDQLKAATTDFMSGMNGGSVFDKIYAHQYALGGFVNGGIWNRDSVPAMLAGGEFIVTANQASRHADILPSINAGTYSGDNSALLEELRAIRAEMAQLKAEMSRNTQISAQGSLAVAAAVSEKNMDMDVRLKMSQRKIAA